MDDSDLDLDDLEAMLYSQVFHGNSNDEILNNLSPTTTTKYNNSQNMYNRSDDMTNPNRYYHQNRRPNDEFHIDRTDYYTQNRDMHCANHNMNNTNPVTLQPVYMQPPVNNIVFIPPQPTQIITTDLDNRKQLKKLLKMQKRMQKKREAKIFRRLQQKEKKANRNFIIHQNVISKPSKSSYIINCDDDEEDDSVQIIEVPVQVISISDDETLGKSAVDLISSDDEEKKWAKKSGQMSPVRKDKDTGSKSGMKQESNTVVSSLANDDDVVYVEPDPKLNEVIDLDRDEKDVSISSKTPSKSANNFKNIITPKERKEMLNTPESNDFLDHSAVDDHANNFNFGLHGSDFAPSTSSEFLRPKTPADNNEIYETESSCSTGDINVTPVKDIPVFQEIDFESPKDLFKGNDLENFGNYITPKRISTPSNIPSILTATAKENDIYLVRRNNKEISGKRKNTGNESDSSSESEYDMQVNNVKTSVKSLQKQSQLPNLSPIQVLGDDDDSRHSEKPKSKGKTKAVKDETISARKSGETASKRKSNTTNDFPNNKKSKATKNQQISKSEIADDAVESTSNIKSCNNVIAVEDNSNSSDSSLYMLSELRNLKTDLELANCLTTTEHEKDNSGVYKPRNFSDYWTEDMKKFYEQDWHIENFTMEKIQANMSDDPKAWKILKEDSQYITLSPPKGKLCYICRKRGHVSTKCPERTKPLKCRLCGGYNHMEPRCPNKICTQCGKNGKYSTIYCRSCLHERNMRCSVCKLYGHIKDRCPDLWRRYHNTTIETRPERQKDNQSSLIPRNKRWCSGCASNGHLDYSCNYYNNHPPTYPYVVSYDDIYGFKKHKSKSLESTQSPKEISKKSPVTKPSATCTPNNEQKTDPLPETNKPPIESGRKIESIRNITIQNPPREQTPNIVIKLNNANANNKRDFACNREVVVHQLPQIPVQNQGYPQNAIVYQLPNASSYIPLVNSNVLPSSSTYNFNPGVLSNDSFFNSDNPNKQTTICTAYINGLFLLEEVPGIDFIHCLENESGASVKINLDHAKNQCNVTLSGNENSIELAKTYFEKYIEEEIEKLIIPQSSVAFVGFLEKCLAKIDKSILDKALARLRSFENELKHCKNPLKKLKCFALVRSQIDILNKGYVQCNGDGIANSLNTLESFAHIFMCEHKEFTITQMQMIKIKEAFYDVFYKRRTCNQYYATCKRYNLKY